MASPKDEVRVGAFLEARLNYGKRYFDKQVSGALDGADVVLSAVFPLVPHASVVDLGCGRGAWLKAATDLWREC